MAATVLYADLRGSKGRNISCGKMDAVPVSLDRRRHTSSLLDGDSAEPCPAVIVRGRDNLRTVYSGEIRQPVVRKTFEFIVKNQTLLYGQGEVTKDSYSGDAEKLPKYTFAPAVGFRPSNFMSLQQPYSKTFPVFFPRGRGDVDDERRDPSLSESEWSIHMLRSVRKELAEFDLFVFAAAFRLDTAKVTKAIHNSASYTRSEEGWVTRNNEFCGPTLRGSEEYFFKTEKDIRAKFDVYGPAQLFFTVSNNPRWEVTLSTALSQDGYDVWHKKDEHDQLGFRGNVFPEKYHVHIPETDKRFSGDIPRDPCGIHDDCHRVRMSRLLEGMDVDELLARNSYNIQRIFEHRVRAVVNDILLSENNGLGVKLYHTVKEFTKSCPSGHVHGLAWRKTDDTLPIFRKLHQREVVTELEKECIESLADSIISTSLSANRLSVDFMDISQERAEKIAGLAARYQQHICSEGCAIENDTDGCQKHFPRLPSDCTLLSCPPSPLLTKAEKEWLVNECIEIKMRVREILDDLRRQDCLDNTSLVQVLQLALGDLTESPENRCIRYGMNRLFPPCEVLRMWKDKFDSDENPHSLLFAMYYAAISTSTWKVQGMLVYQLLVKRGVEECFTVDYNPHILEAMEANMEMSLITFTPENVVKYITKERNRAFSITRSRKELMEDGEEPSVGNLLRKMNQSRRLSLAEAFYRIDSSLYLTETNMPALSVDSDLPFRRRLRLIPDQKGQVFDGLPGQYNEVPDLFSNYVHANR